MARTEAYVLNIPILKNIEIKTIIIEEYLALSSYYEVDTFKNNKLKKKII